MSALWVIIFILWIYLWYQLRFSLKNDIRFILFCFLFVAGSSAIWYFIYRILLLSESISISSDVCVFSNNTAGATSRTGTASRVDVPEFNHLDVYPYIHLQKLSCFNKLLMNRNSVYKSNLQMDSLLNLLGSEKTKQGSVHVHNTSHQLYLLRLSYMQGLHLLECKIGY